jgi:hypothetical protein
MRQLPGPSPRPCRHVCRRVQNVSIVSKKNVAPRVRKALLRCQRYMPLNHLCRSPVPEKTDNRVSKPPHPDSNSGGRLCVHSFDPWSGFLEPRLLAKYTWVPFFLIRPQHNGRIDPHRTEAEIRERVIAHLRQKLFPEGAKAAWWTKAVQLVQKAKGIVTREKTRPLQWRPREIML